MDRGGNSIVRDCDFSAVQPHGFVSWVSSKYDVQSGGNKVLGMIHPVFKLGETPVSWWTLLAEEEQIIKKRRERLGKIPVVYYTSCRKCQVALDQVEANFGFGGEPSEEELEPNGCHDTASGNARTSGSKTIRRGKANRSQLNTIHWWKPVLLRLMFSGRSPGLLVCLLLQFWRRVSSTCICNLVFRQISVI